MAKTKIEVDLVVKGGDSVGQVEGKVVSLKQQLKNLKAELASGNLTGKAFDDAARKAGELQDRIGDVSQRVKNLASDSQKLDGFVNIAQGIVGGFAAVQGITALVGDENEELQKTMVKLQASMTALNGIQAVANMLNKDSAAMTSLNTIKTGAQAIANRFLTATTLESTAATYALRAALIASGIGAIVVLLGAAASAMGMFTDNEEDNISTTDKLKISHEKLTAAIKEEGNEIERVAKMNSENSKARGDSESKQIKIEQFAIQERLENGKQEIASILSIRDAYAVNSKEWNEFEDKRRAQAQINLGFVNDLEISKVRLQSSLSKESQAIADKNSENSQKNKDKALALKKEIEDFEKQQFKQAQKDADEYAIFLNTKDEKEREAKAKKRQEEIDADKIANDIKTANDKKADDDRIKAYVESVQAKEAIAKSSFDILSNLGELALGQQFKQTAIGKTLALAQIATDTALAISALVRNSEANPLNAPTSGLAGIAQFTAGIARITANVVKAKSILSGGGVGGAGGSGSGGGQQNSNPPPITGFTRGVDAQGNQITKVVVLEKDITNSQARVVRIRTNAELI
jgi:hypothetical protein